MGSLSALWMSLGITMALACTPSYEPNIPHPTPSSRPSPELLSELPSLSLEVVASWPSQKGPSHTSGRSPCPAERFPESPPSQLLPSL